MKTIVFCAPDEYVKALQNIKSTPFVKLDDSYRFAYWVYELQDTEEKRDELLNSRRGKEAVELLEKVKKELNEVVVSEDDYLEWTLYNKDVGGIKTYHEIIHNFSIALLMLTINKTAEELTDEDVKHKNSNEFSEKMSGGDSRTGTRQVLNKNNPFADVTIKNQQFFYKTADGNTETLFFDTNNIIEKMDKNGQCVLTMRPGFTVMKEHGVVHRPIRNVTFAGSITEPIINNDDHIYVHID